MRSAKRQRGFSAVEAIMAVLVVAAIVVTGYLAYDRMKEANHHSGSSGYP